MRSCAPIDNDTTEIDYRHRTLIDLLEPRLLFSAEHPLGVFINPDDVTDDWQNAADEQLVQDTVDLLHRIRANNAIEALDELQIIEQPVNDGADNALILDDDVEPLTIIEVTTTDDRVDATDTSSYAAFNNGAGGDGEVSLREAIMVANADASVDIIRLSDGDYALTLGSGQAEDDANAVGDLDLNGHYTIQGENEQDTVISQNVDERRVFELHGGGGTFENLSISDGSADAPDDGVEHGGGVFVAEGAIGRFEDVTFENNSAESRGGAIYADGVVYLDRVSVLNGSAALGGGIYVDNGGVIEIVDSTVAGNTAALGGGFYNHGTLNLFDSVVELNSAMEEGDDNDERGGGIYNRNPGNILIEGTVIRNNMSDTDGGGIVNLGNLIVNDSALIGNEAERFGGGLDNEGNATLTRVRFWGNTTHTGNSSLGGAIFNGFFANLELSHSVLANNESHVDGGGIYTSGNLTISDSTIVNNSNILSDGVGGIGFASFVSSKGATLTNTIVANNTAAGSDADVSGRFSQAVTSGGFNSIGIAENFTATPTDIIGVDPLLGDPELLDNKIVIAVNPDSPVINAGSSASSGELSIDGVRNIGNTPDIGGGVSNQDAALTFWSADSGAIYRSDSEHSVNQKIIDWDSAPLDLQVDAQGHRIYWLDSGNHAIYSANLDGSDIQEERLVNEDAVAFAIDRDDGRYFVAVQGSMPQLLQYADSDVYSTDIQERQGTQIRLLSDAPTDIDLDADSDTIYWTSQTGLDGAVLSSQTAGSGVGGSNSSVNTLVVNSSSEIENPYALVVDDANNIVYWSVPDRSSVFQYDPQPQQGTLFLGEQTPLAVGFNPLNNSVITSDGSAHVRWVDAQSNVSGPQIDLPEVATHVAVGVVLSDEQSSASGAFSDTTFNAITQLTVFEGGPVSLDDEVLGVADADTAAGDVVFTVVTVVGGEILINGVVQPTFTLGDLQTPDRVQFSHAGAEPSTDAFVELTVSDGQMTPAALRIDFQVTPVNDNAPVAQDHSASTRHGDSLSALDGSETSLLLNMSDADEQPGQTFSVVIVEEPAGTVEVDPVTGTFVYTPPASDNVGVDASDSFTYQIRDNAGNLSNVATVDITITALLPPVVNGNGLPDIALDERDDFSTTLAQSLFSSPEGAVPLSFAVTGASGTALPGWLSFDTTTRILSGTPGDSDTGLAQIEIVATDSNGLESAALGVQIDVQNINQQPVINSVSTMSVSENLPGGAVGTVNATDADAGDTLEFTASGDSRFEMNGNELRLVEGEALDFEQEILPLSVVITASDGNGGEASQSVTVNIVNENDAPVLLSQLPGQILSTTSSVVVGTDRFDDQDNDPLVYSLNTVSGEPLPAWIVFDPLNTRLSLGETPASERTDELILTVSDERGGSAQTQFEVRFIPDPVDPVFTANPQFSVAEGGTVVLDNSVLGVTDNDTDAVSVVFTQTDITGGQIQIAGNVVNTFTLSDVQAPSGVEFVHAGGEPSTDAYVELMIDDDQLTPEPVRIDFLVLPVNDNAPLAQDHLASTRHGASVTTLAGGTESLLFNMLDSDEQPGQSFTVEIVDEPAGVLSVDNASGTFEYTPPASVNVGVESSDRFSYQIRDDAGNLSNVAVVDITIAALQAPVIVDAGGLSDVVISELDVYSASLSDSLFSSPEGAGPLSLSVTGTDGLPLPAWLSYDPLTNILSGIPSDADVGIVGVELIATDTNALTSAPLGFQINVQNINQQPVIAPEPEVVVPEPVEPEISAAEPVSPVSNPFERFFESEFDSINRGVIQSSTSEPEPAVSDNGVSFVVQESTSEDSSEPLASVSVYSLNRLFGSAEFAESDSDNADARRNSVLRDNVLSEFLATQRGTERMTPADVLRINVFDDTVNLAALFSTAVFEDPEQYATLANEFNKQQDATESQIAASRIVVGSSVTVTSGLSVGYILYLLRGGAIMSSMLTSLPAWRFVDPLPILSTLNDTTNNDEESLQSIVTDTTEKIVSKSS